jgi:hypothetical protein
MVATVTIEDVTIRSRHSQQRINQSTLIVSVWDRTAYPLSAANHRYALAFEAGQRAAAGSAVNTSVWPEAGATTLLDEAFTHPR